MTFSKDSETQLDLSSIPDLTRWLADIPFAVNKVDALSGGYTNFVFRLHLKTPYKGKSTLALKHSKSFIVENGERVPLCIERQRNEVNALRIARSWVASDAFVTVPEVHHFDDNEHAVIMDDCGVNAVTLKQYCIDFDGSNQAARTIEVERVCSELGKFIHAFHTRSRGDSNALESLGTYEPAKRIFGWALYERLVSTLQLSEPLELLGTEPLDVSESDIATITDIEKEVSEAILGAHGTLVHGDFWSGNVLLDVDPITHGIKSVSVVDWEIARHGIPGLELGQLCAEMELLVRFKPQCAEAAKAGTAAFLSAYKRCGIDREQEQELTRRIVMHVGAHWVVWPPRTAWAGAEETRQLMKEAVKLLIHGHTADSDIARRLRLDTL
jgi:RNA polymerase II subunit A-like phosphatase